MKIKHYSIQDLAYLYNLEEAIQLIDLLKKTPNLTDEQVLQAYELLKFYKDKEQFVDKYKSKFVKEDETKFNKEVGIFFSKFDFEKIKSALQSFAKGGGDYHQTFIEGLVQYKKLFLLTDDQLCQLLDEDLTDVDELLEYEGVVKKYENLIRKKLVDSDDGIEFVVGKYDDATNGSNYYLPKFSNDDIEKMLQKYLKKGSCKFKCLELLLLHKNNEDSYVISRRMKVELKRAIEVEKQKINSECQVTDFFDVSVTIDPHQDQPAIYTELAPNKISISFSGKWILENRDYPTLFNNFIYLFGMVDNNLRITGLYNSRNRDSFSELFETKHVNAYGDSEFSSQEDTNLGIFCAYYSFLKCRCGIQIEDLIEWFFNSFIEKEFGIKGFKIAIERQGKICSRCEYLASEIENALKQFLIFAEEKELNDDLIKVSDVGQKPLLCPSNIPNKYFVLKETQEIESLFFLIFSGRFFLKCELNEPFEGSFFELMKKYENTGLKVSLFRENQKMKELNDLVKLGILCVDDHEIVSWANRKEITALKVFLDTGFYATNNDVLKINGTLNDFLSRGWVERDNHLFSPQERDYLSYYLNNEKFSNALHLRNTYCHGNGMRFSDDDNEKNYYILLRIFVLIVIKINDELCYLFDQMKHQ